MPNEQQEYGPLGMERTLKHHGRALEETEGEHSRGRTARAKAEGQEFSRGFLGPESCHCGYGTRSVFIEHVLFSKRGICVCSWLEIRIQG